MFRGDDWVPERNTSVSDCISGKSGRNHGGCAPLSCTAGNHLVKAISVKIRLLRNCLRKQLLFISMQK